MSAFGATQKELARERRAQARLQQSGVVSIAIGGERHVDFHAIASDMSAETDSLQACATFSRSTQRYINRLDMEESADKAALVNFHDGSGKLHGGLFDSCPEASCISRPSTRTPSSLCAWQEMDWSPQDDAAKLVAIAEHPSH